MRQCRARYRSRRAWRAHNPGRICRRRALHGRSVRSCRKGQARPAAPRAARAVLGPRDAGRLLSRMHRVQISRGSGRAQKPAARQSYLRLRGPNRNVLASRYSWSLLEFRSGISEIAANSVDHIIVLGDAHLRRILRSYAHYYKKSERIGRLIEMHRYLARFSGPEANSDTHCFAHSITTPSMPEKLPRFPSSQTALAAATLLRGTEFLDAETGRLKSARETGSVPGD